MMTLTRIVRGARNRLRHWRYRMTNALSQPFRSLNQRREVCRFRALPGVSFKVVLDRASKDPLCNSIRGGENQNTAGMELMRHFVAPGDRVLDLGGHIGLFSLTAAAFGCEVLTIEGSRHNAALLAASARLNGFDKIRLVNCAVGEKTGLVAFCEDGPFGSIVGSGMSRPATAHVPMLTAETLLAGLGWDRIAFVKMDVEGSEVAALAGFQRFLNSPDAPIVFYESNAHTLNFFGQSTRALHEAFAASGYQCYQVGDKRLTSCSPSQIQGTTYVDYLAVKGPFPALPEGWKVANAFTDAELIQQLHADLTDGNPDVRASVARRLAQAEPRWRSSPIIQTALGQLLIDSNDHVREASSWHARRAA